MSCERVAPAALRRRVDPATLGLASTRELADQVLPWIGQARAEAAARFGLAMAQPGYNLLVVGEVGTGRSTLMRQLLRHIAAERPVPPDLCFLRASEAPEQALALRLPAGQGRLLRERLQQFARWLQTEVPRRLAEAALQHELQRPESSNEGQPPSAGAEPGAIAEALAAPQREALQPVLARELRAIRDALQPEPVQARRLDDWLQGVQAELLAHLGLFQPAPHAEAARREALQALLAGLRVNLAVDNQAQQGAPVVQEDNPGYRQLFGCVELAAEGERSARDVTRIRAGSLLRAHGGYLVLHLGDLLADAPVWDKLRRFLRSMRLQIEEPAALATPVAAVALRPEAVAVDVKLVLLATPEEFEAVQSLDPELAERFRCKVDFADSFAASSRSWHETAVLVARVCARWGLPHCDAAATALLIEDSHRRAQDQFRQSTQFAQTEALVLESAAIARARGLAEVTADDVRAAWQARRQRHDEPEERLLDTLAQGERVLPVAGHLQASLNGLSVIQLGDHSFGFPVRVTARTQPGDKGVLSIDREVELSGPLHGKGVLVLHSYLMALFGHLAPLALEASLVFEQEYGGIEGDSASCAELYALLSDLAGVPLAQGIAVTGAFNASGDLLPVGGINEKIEGFFRSCERLGLDGRQGVLMPARNLRHLMLDERVVEAVRAGRFHIHAASTVAQGMTLMTGLPWGERGAQGYAPGSVLGHAQARLRRYRHAVERVAAHAEHPPHKRRPLRPS